MTRKPSAAQRAAEMLIRNHYNELGHAVLREDRERRQMERALIRWAEGNDNWNEIAKIARRLKGKP